MKKLLFLLPFVLTYTFSLAQQGIYEKDTTAKCACFEDYYTAFTKRGALPVPDGEHTVVFSARKNAECFCGEGKIVVSNGNLQPGLLVKKSDGSYEPAKKTLHPKTNTGEGENPAKFTITNGMSASFLTDDYYIVNLFFIDYLKPDGVNNAVAPDPGSIKGRKAELTVKEKEVIQKAYEGLAFETGKSVIKKSSYAHLNLLAEMLKEKADYQVQLSGYTDNTGSAATNLALSKKRAEAVKDYLVSKGIDANRIAAEGYGIENPIGDNATAEGRAKNRRVEFLVTSAK